MSFYVGNAGKASTVFWFFFSPPSDVDYFLLVALYGIVYKCAKISAFQFTCKCVVDEFVVGIWHGAIVVGVTKPNELNRCLRKPRV